MKMKISNVSYLTLAILLVLLIAAPIPVGAATLLWLGYWYGLGGRHKNQPFVARLKQIKRKWLLLATLLTLVTLGVHYTTDYATQFGFPTTVITYYGLPARMGGVADWFALYRVSAINPAQALLNWVIYLLLLLLGERLWQSIRMWRKIPT